MRSSWRVNADDFGWTDGHNWAVEQAHRRGILTHASLMCTGEGFAEAVEIARRNPSLGVGVHLTLNEGQPLLPAARLPLLTTSQGRFHDNPWVLLPLWGRVRPLQREVRDEWRAQIERALAAGLRITHLDSHKHVHLLPPLVEVVLSLAGEYRIPYVRLPLERFSLRALRRAPTWFGLWSLARRARPRWRETGVQFAERFVGIARSGAMDGDTLRRLLKQPAGLTEIMLHPAVLTPAVRGLQRRYAWAARYRFEQELAALCQPIGDRVHFSGAGGERG